MNSHSFENSRIYCGDCMGWMRDTPTGYYDLSVCDPPYGIGLVKTENGNWGIRKENKGNISESTKWDFSPPDQSYFEELFRVSKNQIIWGANHFISKMPFDSPSWIVWDKKNGGTYFADCELAWTSFDCAVRKFEMVSDRKRIHLTQKPIALYDWIFSKYANPGDRILDTHLGSGSSRIAAYKHGLDFTGYELNKEYFDASVNRFMEALNGRQPVEQLNFFQGNLL